MATTSSSLTSAQVIVVYGITPLNQDFLDGKTEWAFDSKFDPESPWTQRAMLSMCSDAQQQENLNVLSTSCWIFDFRDWLNARGERFPVGRFGDFHSRLGSFMSDNEDASGAMWLNENGQMRATSLRFEVKLGYSSYYILEDQKLWLEYVDKQNAVAHTTADMAWPTSQSWADAEAYYEALWSAWAIAGLTCAAVVLAGLLYTYDMTLVFTVVVVALLACNG